MRLTNFSDYALRMLMYAAYAGDRLITIEEVARTFNVSKTHLNKVANTLTRSGYLKAVRGRSGGLALGLRPEMIRIGDVIRLTEPDFGIVECFVSGNQCVLTGSCKLSSVFGEAMASFQTILDRYTLADVALTPQDFPVRSYHPPVPA
ncbi:MULTISPECIES: RrF2 family transcriptional regulator [Rhizobium]|uniref:RrF2 family transcriptional regulator n=1 Tax=Rhizobium TaxID=379 RepID=UPI00046294D6|nr:MULTISPECIES: Rrf2 family transcriptional regulator [Rhizobium]UFS80118.1 Rrf2 family transcriptional regulator [Rhizobium sp. T136]